MQGHGMGDTLLGMLRMLMRWRFSLSVLLSTGLAIALATAFDWFNAKHGWSMVAIGTGFGLYWHARANAGIGLLAKIPEPAISKPVSFIALAFFGAVTGPWIAIWFGSWLAACAALAAAPLMVALWRNRTGGRQLIRRDVLFHAFSILAGPGLIAAGSLLVN